MRVEQTSPTTFELQSDNGCHAMAGAALNTMGYPGVYWWRDMSKHEAEEHFKKDPLVQKAMARWIERFSLPTDNPDIQKAMAAAM